MLISKVIEQIFQAIDGEWSDQINLVGVGTDTRSDLTNCLFVPLVGENFDGHDFLEQAIRQGAKAALWQKDHPRPEQLDSSFPLIRVTDTLLGLQQLAQAYLVRVQPKVIAITGSNGKTTTKDLVYSVCRAVYRTHCTKGNFNNHIGLPLTILSMPENTDVLILEMGMNHFGEIESLAKIAQPDLAIITNIGESHIEHLGSRQGIAKAKLEVVSQFTEAGVLIIDGDEPLLTETQPFKTISVGFDRANDYYIKNCQVLNDCTQFTVNDEHTVISTPLLGRHQAKNTTYSIVVGKFLGLSNTQIQSGLNRLETTDMRFERLEGKNGVALINDAYNASPTSMRVTIESFAQMDGYQEKILVLGDMLELGSQSSDYHQTIGQEIPEEIDCVYTIGKEASQISQSTAVKAKHFETMDALVAQLQTKQTKGTIILFKASRAMKFEQLIEALV